MKNFKFIAVGFLTSLFVFSGCSWLGGEDKEAANAVKEAVNNLSEVKSANYEFNVKGDFLERTGDATVGDEAAEQEKISLDLKFNGNYDVKDIKSAKFLLGLNFDLTPDGSASLSAQSGSAEIRLVGDVLYFALNKLTDFDGELPKAMIEPYLGKWWSIAIPEEIKSEIVLLQDETNLTPEQKQLKELFENTMFYKNVKYIGDEKLDGIDVAKYSAELDTEAAVDYIKEVAKASGREISEQDMDEIVEQSGNIKLSGELYVGKQDKTLRKFIGTLNATEFEAADGGSLDLEISYYISNLNGEVKVDVPEGAQEFNPLALLGF